MPYKFEGWQYWPKGGSFGPTSGREREIEYFHMLPDSRSAIIDGQHIHIALIGQRALQAVVSQFLATSVHFFVC